MPVAETMIRELRQEMNKQFQEMRKLLMGRNVVGNWVDKPTALAMMGIKSRRLTDLRIHQDKGGRKVGEIRWRKSGGKKTEYFKPDIEKWLNKMTVQ